MKLNLKRMMMGLLAAVLIVASVAPVYAEEADTHMEGTETNEEDTVANLYGIWTNEGSGRIRMQISPGIYESLSIRVLGSNSASEGTEYYLSANPADDAETFAYENGVVVDYTFTEDGTIQKEMRSVTASGTIAIHADEDGKITLEWTDQDAIQENQEPIVLVPVLDATETVLGVEAE